ncbi:hypothetical protein [Oceanobacillus polygoni]|uniref:Transposase n=1 Tax=Oceanobacillus polygoni TaxID=1235259 RepID=A0A9X0YW99_9BACI|nr:hypothetical protein [Oceanobacillus polygoni]MBP2079191.1 hypothetical protein [Oceanobacillus polygoni]
MREEIMKQPKEEAEKVLELQNYYFDKGVVRGFERGIEHGIDQGKKAQAIEVAKKLLSKEMPLGILRK